MEFLKGPSLVLIRLSSNHYLYADDRLLDNLISQLWISLITSLTLKTLCVSNWMSSNFLSLNPSKTKFLIFGLPQLSKLNNPTIHVLACTC